MKMKVRYKVIGHVTVEVEGLGLEDGLEYGLKCADASVNRVDLGDLEDVEFVDRELVKD